jgi:mannose-6-phosphate isomerase-like protein (cupin superfamily)
MLRKREGMRREVRSNLRGGQGDLRFTHVLEPGDIHAGLRLAAEISIPPGGSIGPHGHEGEEEIYFVRKGEGILTDGDETKRIAAGDVAVCLSGGTHAIENGGNEDLEMLAVILLNG